MRKRPFLSAVLIFFLGLFLMAMGAGMVSSIYGEGGFSGSGDKIAVVEIKGIILDAEETIAQIKKHVNNPRVKAIVLRIDSPGGAVAPSQEIYQEVKRAAKSKQIVASMGSIAASGGYYVACPAHKIIANPGTITGSIGVIIEFTNISGLLDMMRVKTETIKSGDYKDIGSPLRDMKSNERKLLQSFVDNVHNQFVNAVAESRGMDKEKVREIANGMIYSGEQALGLGLVDELGGFEDAIKLAGKLAGIEGEPSVIYPPKERPGLLDMVLGNDADVARFLLQRGINAMYLANSQAR